MVRDDAFEVLVFAGDYFRPQTEDFLRRLEWWMQADGSMSKGFWEEEIPC